MESDEAIAKRMQADLDAESARHVSNGSRAAGAGAGFGSTGGPGEDLDEDELMRLKLAQFAHREAIYQNNAEGPFAPKGAAASEAVSSPAGAGSRGLKKGAGGKSSTLSPMERIARDHRIYETSFHNRVASEEEIAAAKEGPKAVKKLAEKREKEAKAMQAMAAMGFTVSRPQDNQPMQGQAVAQANQAMLAARQGAHWSNPHAMAAPALPPTYLSGQRAAASAEYAAAAPSAAASAASSSSSAAAGPSAFGVEKDRKKKKKSKDKDKDKDADRDADAAEGSKKKKKKKKDKDRDRAEGEGGDEADKKKKKKKDKDKEKAGAGAGVASPTAAAPSAPSASAAAAASPVDLVDLLRDYSITPSSRRIDAAEIDTLLKKG